MENDEAPLSHEVLLQHAAWVRRLAGELVHDSGAAEDVAQETWLAFLRSRPSTERPLRPWLARVVRNRAALRVRKNAGRRAREAEVARPERVPSSDELVERAEMQRGLVEAVLALDEPYRSTLLLRYYEGLTPSEIAALRELPAATVRTHLFRGLERLREKLDREHDGDRAAWAGMLAPLLVPARGAAVSTAWPVALASAAVLSALSAWGVWGLGDVDPRTNSASKLAASHASSQSASDIRFDSAATREPVTSSSAPTTRELRLVDRTGAPLAGFGVRTETAEFVSNADGIVELPAETERLDAFDDTRLAVNASPAHGVRTSQLFAARTLGIPEDGRDELTLTTGPQFLVELVAPMRIDEHLLEARLVAEGLSEFGNDGLPRQVAPLRAANHGFATAWVRFGAEPAGADDPRASWRFELYDKNGFWRGVAQVDDVRGQARRAVRVELLSKGTVAGRVDTMKPEGIHVSLHERSADGPLLTWKALDASGTFELRWVPAGEHTLVVRSTLRAPMTRAVTVRGGERTLVEVNLEDAALAGALSGRIVSESGTYSGQVLVFLLDGAGGFLGVFPATWKERSAEFRFDMAPEGPLRLEFVSLASSVSFIVEPAQLTAPSDTVVITLLDRLPVADWSFDVLDADTGSPLTSFEVEARIGDGMPRRFFAEVAEEGAVPAWTLVAGGLRWNRFESVAPLRGLASDADLRWTVRAEGYRPAEGGAEAFAVDGASRKARVLLERL